MKATIVDLRYRMKSILEALSRNETITILYHGQEKAVLSPIESNEVPSVKDHPFFGMHSEEQESVANVIDRLRESRY